MSVACRAGVMERMRKYITIPNSPIPMRADANGNAVGAYPGGRGPLAAGAAGRARENGDASADGGGLSEMDRRQREIYNKQQQLLREQRSADQEKLLACISGGCSDGVPDISSQPGRTKS